MAKRRKKTQGAAANSPKKGKAANATTATAATTDHDAAAPAPGAVPVVDAPAPAPVPAPAAAPATSPSKPETGDLPDETIKLLRDLAKRPAAGTKLKPVDFDSCRVSDLKSVLKLNDRTTTGNKRDLIKSVIEYMRDGCPPRCPDCGGGRLRFGKVSPGGRKVFYCPGFMQDVEFIDCWFRCNKDSGEVTRIPWMSP